MHIRLDDSGRKKIAVIKELRTYFGFSLREAKDWSDRAPVVLPSITIPKKASAMIRALREVGATVTVANPSAIDKLTAVGYIQAAELALGEGDLDEVRSALRSALLLVGDV